MTKSAAPSVSPPQERPRFQLDDYDNVIGFLISRTAYNLARRFNEELGRIGLELRGREFPVLNRLHQHGSLTQTELCDLTYPDRPAMTRMLDRLIKMGLVQKAMAENDRRAFLVCLTPSGHIVRDHAARIVADMLEKICWDVSPKDMQTTIRVMHQINDSALVSAKDLPSGP